MNRKLEKIKLGDVLDARRGMSCLSEFYADSGRYIRLTLGNFKYPDCGWKENTSKGDLYFTGQVKDEFILKKGDIITPLTEQVRGLLGNTATIPMDDIYIQSSDIALIIPKTNKIYGRFAYYLVSSPIVKKQLDSSSQQTKIRHTSPNKIKDCIAFIPNKEKQKKISRLLDAIDSQISLNTKINKLLEEQLKTLYDYWFTQFDFPDENGKSYQQSGGKMVYNSKLKREIPEGWEVKELGDNDFISIIKPGVEKFRIKKYYPTSQIEGMDIFDGISIKYENRESRANMQPTLCSVWFAKMKKSIKHIFLNEEMRYFVDNSILSTGFCGIQCSKENFEYIASFLGHPYFEKKKDTLAHGATQEAVNNEDLINIYLPIPDERVLKLYHNSTQNIYKIISKNICENQHLISLRNFLLPLLMNGQAKVE